MSARRRARRKGIISPADKWKNKVWTDIRAPEYIADKSLGQSPTTNVDTIVGRTVKASLMDLTGSFKDLNYQFTFKVVEVLGNKAVTEFFGHELSRDFRRSQVRNHRSQIESIFNINIKDNAKIRVSLFVVTPHRVHSSVKKELRAVIAKKLLEVVEPLTFEAFVHKLMNYEILDEVRAAAEELSPIKILEVAKVKVIRYPAGSLADRIAQAERDRAAAVIAASTEEEEEEEEAAPAEEIAA